MNENLYEKNLQKFADFQSNLMESVTKIYEQLDLKKSIDEMTVFQEKFTKGMKILMEMKPEDAASDMMEKEEVLRIGKMRLFHYKPTVTGRKLSKVPTLITYALVNRQ